MYALPGSDPFTWELLETIDIQSEECGEKSQGRKDDCYDREANDGCAEKEAAVRVFDTGIGSLELEHVLYGFLDPFRVSTKFNDPSFNISQDYLERLQSPAHT